MVQVSPTFRKRLKRIVPSIHKEVRLQLEKEAEKLTDLMRAYAPVDKGDLIRSIGWTWGQAPDGSMTVGTVEDSGLRITIYAGGGDAFHARFMEFGTLKTPASPFFYPAYRNRKKAIRANVKRAVRRGIKKAK